jgi:putative transposase
MPRTARIAIGDTIYHVLNRAHNRGTIFETAKDYKHFESLLEEAKALIDMRILAYAIMPNHWHMVLYPRNDKDMSEFMRWLTTTHVRHLRVATKSIGYGSIYQGAYKSFIVQEDKHLIDLIRYVEQNPLRAKLVKRAEDWQWGSLYRRQKGTTQEKKLLAPLPTRLPVNYLASVNEVYNTDTLTKIRNSVNKSAPYGGEEWALAMVKEYHLESTLRPPGRPRKS